MEQKNSRSNIIDIEVTLPSVSKIANIKIAKTTPLEGIMVMLAQNLYLNLTNLKFIFQVDNRVLDQRKCLDEQPLLTSDDFIDNKIAIKVIFQSLGA